MNTVELEAGKMQLVRAIASINDPEVLAAVREVMYEKLGCPPLQYTKEQLEEALIESEEDFKAGRYKSSGEVFERLEADTRRNPASLADYFR